MEKTLTNTSNTSEGIATRNGGTGIENPTLEKLPAHTHVSIDDLRVARKLAIEGLALLPVVINALEELMEWKQEFKHRVEKEDRY